MFVKEYHSPRCHNNWLSGSMSPLCSPRCPDQRAKSDSDRWYIRCRDLNDAKALWGDAA